MKTSRNNGRVICLILATVSLGSLLLPSPSDAAALVSPFEAEAERAIASYSGSPDLKETPESRGPGEAGKAGKNVRFLGGVVPHHNIALAMIVRFYERVSSPEVKRVWLFSPDHFRRARKLAAVCDADWKLDTGTLASDKDACAALDSLAFAESDAPMFRGEHGITIHIPLIARYFPNACVVPIVLDRNIPDMGLIILRKKILELAGPDDVILLSMDLSHYKTPEAMALEDRRTLKVLREMKPLETPTLDVDARRAAALVLYFFRDMGAKEGKVLERWDSSAVLGHRVESGTSYATVTYEIINDHGLGNFY
ncbi:MAG: AmmeMemoRadiSam system protein B [Synergistaceae bacterium]|jgi:AmmeMemoRadiSam system protein B|nr:AmmeMemoRadiSam system protein B [Synergistaceae bacterium]